jgi:hypothetical protein
MARRVHEVSGERVVIRWSCPTRYASDRDGMATLYSGLLRK